MATDESSTIFLNPRHRRALLGAVNLGMVPSRDMGTRYRETVGVLGKNCPLCASFVQGGTIIQARGSRGRVSRWDRAGRDSSQLLPSEDCYLGIWVDRLIDESTGKEQRMFRPGEGRNMEATSGYEPTGCVLSRSETR